MNPQINLPATTAKNTELEVQVNKLNEVLTELNQHIESIDSRVGRALGRTFLLATVKLCNYLINRGLR